MEGGEPNTYLFGIDGYPGAVTRAGLYLDAPARDDVLDPAVLRNPGEDRHLDLGLQTTGPARTGNSVLEHGAADGSVTVSVKQSGRVELPRIKLSETGVIGLTPLEAAPEAPTEGDTSYDAGLLTVKHRDAHSCVLHATPTRLLLHDQRCECLTNDDPSRYSAA